jgi:vesicle coat complex subunit
MSCSSCKWYKGYDNPLQGFLVVHSYNRLLSRTLTHSSSSSSSYESTVRIEVSSPRKFILRSVSFLLYFTLNLIYVSRPFMHEIIRPIIPIIMSYGLTEYTIQICSCLNIPFHVVALTRAMSVSAYLAPR